MRSGLAQPPPRVAPKREAYAIIGKKGRSGHPDARDRNAEPEEQGGNAKKAPVQGVEPEAGLIFRGHRVTTRRAISDGAMPGAGSVALRAPLVFAMVARRATAQPAMN